MRLEYLVYHENKAEVPYRPQEDFYAHHENIFVVADGVTHDYDIEIYPNPSDSAKVAQIICNTIVEALKNSEQSIEDIREAIETANQNVHKFNGQRKLYKNRDTNGHSMGAAVFAVVVIKDDKLLYGVLDDCYFSIFSDDLVDHPKLRSYVDEAAKHFDSNYDWGKQENRKVWRKVYRNNIQNIDGKKIGYGAIDGSSGFEQFVQYGEEKLKSGDLVCVYTDGFIKTLTDQNFVKHIKDNDLSNGTLEFISKYTQTNNQNKEKTGYFIKYPSKS